MAITIKQLLNYSWMSQASYLDFLGLLPNDQKLEINLKTGTINSDKIFAVEQARTFTSRMVKNLERVENSIDFCRALS